MCTHTAEVIVCKHVANGEHPECDLDPGQVNFAICPECRVILDPLVESKQFDEAIEHITMLCRECALELGVPKFVQ